MERIWIAGLGLGFPMTVLALLLGFGITIGHRLTPDTMPATLTYAEASRTGWTFSYDGRPGFRTSDVLHIPANQEVAVVITTADVIHSFWVPRLAGKLDAIPGHPNRLTFEAGQPGTYAGRSAEFGGAGYLQHRFEVRAHDAASWQAFLRGDVN